MDAVILRGVFVLALALVSLSSAGETGWKYRWPGVIPEVAEKTLEPTKRVVLNADTSVEVSCGENAAADKWVADKMLLWFGCRPAVKPVALSELPDGDEAYVLGAKDGKL